MGPPFSPLRPAHLLKAERASQSDIMSYPSSSSEAKLVRQAKRRHVSPLPTSTTLQKLLSPLQVDVADAWPASVWCSLPILHTHLWISLLLYLFSCSGIFSWTFSFISGRLFSIHDQHVLPSLPRLCFDLPASSVRQQCSSFRGNPGMPSITVLYRSSGCCPPVIRRQRQIR